MRRLPVVVERGSWRQSAPHAKPWVFLPAKKRWGNLRDWMIGLKFSSHKFGSCEESVNDLEKSYIIHIYSSTVVHLLGFSLENDHDGVIM